MLPPLAAVLVAAEDDTGVTPAHDTSNSGVSLKVLPTMPKLGFGVTGAASWRVNQYVLTTPKLAHPTLSQ